MKILAAIDGSNFSSLVVEELASRKWPKYSHVKLVTVINVGEDEQSNTYKAVQQNLKSIATYLSKIHPDIEFQSDIRQGTAASDTLLQLSMDWYAELVIVAAHGKGMLERVLLGSVSEAFLEHGMVPLIIAKQGTSKTQQHSINILVPSDNSLFSDRAIEWLLKQKWTKPINIKLVTVLPSTSEQLDQEYTASLQQWEAYIRQYNAPVKLEYKILVGTPQDEILSEAKSWPAHHIIMGSQGLTGLKRLLIGSVARAVSRNADCSVEIVRMADLKDYYRKWESTDKRTYIEDLKETGVSNTPHIEPL